MHRAMVGSAKLRKRFLLEARAANLINHPNVVDIFEYGELPTGVPYLVMELLQGQNLSQRLAEGPVPPALAPALTTTASSRPNRPTHASPACATIACSTMRASASLM